MAERLRQERKVIYLPTGETYEVPPLTTEEKREMGKLSLLMRQITWSQVLTSAITAVVTTAASGLTTYFVVKRITERAEQQRQTGYPVPPPPPAGWRPPPWPPVRRFP